MADENGTRATKPASPCVMVIFGAAGDLTKRLLMPSLYNLGRQKLLPEEFAIVGFTRTDLTEEQFRQKVGDDLRQFVKDADADLVAWIQARTYYVKSEFDNDEGYQRLTQKLQEVDGKHQTKGNYFFYLATSPEFFLTAAQHLSRANLLKEEAGQWRRLVIEKPFGTDLASAKQLNKDLQQLLDEKQIYRIDHYLGKETVQNIMVFRFANGIFEPIWNRRYIDHVQITVAETVGVEMRGGYYDTAGALRDMVPNHIMQLIALTAMEPPISFAADAVREEQTKALHAIPPPTPESVAVDAVRGQYGPGQMDGKDVPGYRQEQRVKPDSKTETYAAMKLMIDNWRWAGVPFYLRTGKHLPRRVTEIAVQFRRAPFVPFQQTGIAELPANVLVMNIQPDEGISLNFEAKVPGPSVRIAPVDMKFAYADYFNKEPRTGYETLLYDVMIGDQTLFKTADNVEVGWSIVQPLLDAWAAQSPPDFPNYAAGTAGPAAADEMLARDGRRWRPIA